MSRTRCTNRPRRARHSYFISVIRPRCSLRMLLQLNRGGDFLPNERHVCTASQARPLSAAFPRPRLRRAGPSLVWQEPNLSQCPRSGSIARGVPASVPASSEALLYGIPMLQREIRRTGTIERSAATVSAARGKTLARLANETAHENLKRMYRGGWPPRTSEARRKGDLGWKQPLRPRCL